MSFIIYYVALFMWFSVIMTKYFSTPLLIDTEKDELIRTKRALWLNG